MTDERHPSGPPIEVGDRVTIKSEAWPHLTHGTVMEHLDGTVFFPTATYRTPPYLRIRCDEGDHAGVCYILRRDEVERDPTPPRLRVVQP